MTLSLPKNSRRSRTRVEPDANDSTLVSRLTPGYYHGSVTAT
jgi:hypothetical protein